MNETQLSDIRNYLLEKKLPIDILLEVQDHIISQIRDFQREEKLTFEEAFTKTKNSWEKDLKPYWKGGMSLEDVSDFMRRMRKENDISNLRWSFKWGWIPIVVIYVGALVLKSHYFGFFFLTILVSLVLFPFIKYFKNLRNFRMAKKYDNHVLTLHQHSVFIFFLVLSPVINIFNNFLQNAESYRNIILMKGNTSQFIGITISIAIVVFSVFFSLSAQRNYLRQIEKVKPFLKYLKPSA